MVNLFRKSLECKLEYSFIMFGNIWEYMKPVTWLLIILSETGYTYGSEAIGGHQESQVQSTVLPATRPEKLTSQSRFLILPNTTWKKATEVCLTYDSHLLLANDHDVMERELLPLMDATDFVWVSIKDYGLNCRNETGLNNTEETVCGSYIRVSMKPTAEKLKYGLCGKGGGIGGKKMADPVTWIDMKSRCTEIGGDLYSFSTVKEVKAMLSILRPNQTFWTNKHGDQDFPEFGLDSTTTSVCIGMVKLIDTFIYMADDCNNKHNFICDKNAQEYAPAVEALEKATPFYIEEEIEKAMTHATSHPHPTLPDGTAGGSNSDQDKKPASIGTIVGAVVAVVVVMAILGLGLYCYLRIRKIRAYRKSLFRYETKKSSMSPGVICHEITHLTIPEQELSPYDQDLNPYEAEEDMPIKEQNEHDDVYYEKRYEPLQRELVENCTKKLKMRNLTKEEHLNQMMMYDPLRKDSFLSSGHASSCSDGLNISYERYDPDSAEMRVQHQTVQNSRQYSKPLKHPVKHAKTMEGNVSYLKHIKTLDDLDQYENSHSLQEKQARLVEEHGKQHKDSQNEVKRLADLDQYENYNLPPLPALPTKTRPRKAAKSRPLSKRLGRPDCYENHDLN